MRSEDARADVAICVAKKSAKFILESKENDSNVPSENILHLIDNNEKSGRSILVNENDFLMLYKDETSDKTSDKIETTETIWLKTGFVEGESVADIS